ncbi:MAG: hypothetical protein R2911_31310 [Caldilineaceae bacterium]
MSSLFRFMGETEPEAPAEVAAVDSEITDVQPTLLPNPDAAPASAAPLRAEAIAAGAPPESNGAPAQTVVLTAMLAALNGFLLPAPTPLPQPSVSVVQLTERTVGLGNFRGNSSVNDITSAALKGGRLEGTVRFQLWASTPQALDAVVNELHGRLLTAKAALWNQGFLRLNATGASEAAPVTALSDWRKSLDFDVLYEYRYRDADGAQSLIARIPIHSDPEEFNSLLRETNVVTNGLARWDNLTAPPLMLTGRGALSQLAALFFAADALPTGPVRLVRTFDGAATPPAVYGTLPAFRSAVTNANAPERNGQFTFASFSDFLGAFSNSGNPLILGDWDEDDTPDSYAAHQLDFMPAIPLSAPTDRFYIVYDPGAAEPKFDRVAVLYLRSNGSR